MTHHLILAIPFLLAGALLASSDVTPGMNRFAATAYRQLAQNLAQDRGNLILSPFSISTALSMLLDGARGQTAAGMAATLDQLARPRLPRRRRIAGGGTHQTGEPGRQPTRHRQWPLATARLPARNRI